MIDKKELTPPLILTYVARSRPKKGEGIKLALFLNQLRALDWHSSRARMQLQLNEFEIYERIDRDLNPPELKFN